MWYKKKTILALAPMADYTDSPFCRVCREVAGEDFVIYREMVSAEAIVRESKKTLDMASFHKSEKPIVLQIFGADPKTMRQAAEILIKERSLHSPSGLGRDNLIPSGIDINMGCPVPKVTGKTASGATLMRNQDIAVEIVKELKNADLGVPISVKTRLGWTSDRDILEFAPKLEEAGADLISIHGRTKKQGYSGEANWERIAEVKKLVSIPVIANGDVKTSEDIERCLEITGADGVMIGRGALGNPWIFCSDIRYQISDSKIKEVVLRHAELHLEQYGEEFGLKTFRKHLVWYFKNKPGIKKLREELVKIETLDDLKRILINY
ncbi:tRNA-dihydrouridine synthase [Patescibacteria group bacterium]|nr:tRNA-dihydrouridine synthase [Patescibacteria group bacterium]MBU1895389.1 tRNA-dihydrouridine synthase [Patescibacteria group bacterium]